MTRANRSNSLHVEPATTTDELLAIGAQWRQLHELSGLGPFTSWEWQFAWWNHLGGRRHARVLLARDVDGVLRGIVPLGLEETRLGFSDLRRLSFLADDSVGSDYLDVIATPDWRAAVIAAAAGYLAGCADDWDLIEWRDMDADSDSALLLAKALGGNQRIERIDGLRCPGQDLQPGMSFDEFLRTTRRCENYARRRRWLERQPGFRIDIAAGGPELVRAREVFFFLHALRWAPDGGSAGIPNELVRAFHVEASDRLALREQVLFYTLWVGGEAVASVYGLLGNETFHYYQSGMNPAWRSKSVGLVLIGASFADAIARGLKRYDFLRGEEAYKSDWVSQQRRLTTWRLPGPSGRARLACQLDRGLRLGKGRIKQWLLTRQASGLPG